MSWLNDGQRKKVGRLGIIAVILLALIQANAKDVAEQRSESDAAHSLTERALNSDVEGLEEALERERRNDVRFKRALRSTFKAKHFMTSADFNALGYRQHDWNMEMSRRAALYSGKKLPNIISVIVDVDDTRLENDIAVSGNLVPGGQGNLYRTNDRYQVYDARITTTPTPSTTSTTLGQSSLHVDILIDRGIVNLILGYDRQNMTLTMHYEAAGLIINLRP